MPCLQVQRTVPERITALYTFAAPDAQFLIDRVLKVGIFNVCPLDRTGGAELAFRSCISGFGTRLEITAAKVTVSAHRIGMDAFHSRVGQNTVDCTFFTLDTDVGIQLPDHFFGRRLT
jgi:hypothetical protein